jgi:hypothetical protein
MEKLDLRKIYKHLYQPSAKQVGLVDVPPFQFAMIDGQIEPGHVPGDSPSFQQAFEALYGISYTLKFASKLHPDNPVDYKVMAMEALWWVEGGAFARKNGYLLRGKHHEIYLGDPRRTAPEKLKTVLRQPVVAGGQGQPAGS